MQLTNGKAPFQVSIASPLPEFYDEPDALPFQIDPTADTSILTDNENNIVLIMKDSVIFKNALNLCVLGVRLGLKAVIRRI